MADTLAIEGVKGRRVHHDRSNLALNSTVQAGLCYKRIRWVKNEKIEIDNENDQRRDFLRSWVAVECEYANERGDLWTVVYRRYQIRSLSLFLCSYADALQLNATGQFPHNTLPSTPQEDTVNIQIKHVQWLEGILTDIVLVF